MGNGGYYPEVGPSPPSADRDPGSTIYATAYGVDTPEFPANKLHLAAIDATTGKVRMLVNKGTEYTAVQGPTVNGRNVIGFGDGKSFGQLSLNGGSTSVTLPGPVGRATYDPVTQRFFVTTYPNATGASHLCGVDSL